MGFLASSCITCYVSLSCYTGTTKITNLNNNFGSLGLKLRKEDLKEICEAMPVDEVGGHRDFGNLSVYGYKFANTPGKVIIPSGLN